MSEPITDAHVHIWDRNRLRYDWLDGLPELSASRLPHAYDGTEGLVSSCVFVQAGAVPEHALSEAEWVQSLAMSSWPELRGIVADADLLGDGLEWHLDDLSKIPLWKGVRHLLQDTDAETLGSKELVYGLSRLATRGVSFDACVRWWQLDNLAATLERASSLSVVLDHLGKPPIGSEDSSCWRVWELGLRRLAKLPNVSVKLSGLAAETTDRQLFERDAPRALHTALETFGAERSMFGSDWPVSAVGGAGGTTKAWAEFVRAQASDAEWPHIASLTAARTYRLVD